MGNINKAINIAKKMLNIDEDKELDRKLQYMIVDACNMTEACGGVFLSRQAIAAIISCWKFM